MPTFVIDHHVSDLCEYFYALRFAPLDVQLGGIRFHGDYSHLPSSFVLPRTENNMPTT